MDILAVPDVDTDVRDARALAERQQVAWQQTITFDGRVGNGLGVQSFAEFTDDSATTVFNTDVVSTTGDQNYSGTVVVSDTAFSIELLTDRSVNFTDGAKFITHNTEVFIIANSGGTTSGAFTGAPL